MEYNYSIPIDSIKLLQFGIKVMLKEMIKCITINSAVGSAAVQNTIVGYCSKLYAMP